MHRLFRYSFAPNKTHLPTSRQLLLPYTSTTGEISGYFSHLTTHHQLNLSITHQLPLPHTTSTIKNEVFDKLGHSSHLATPHQLNLPTSHQLLLPYTSDKLGYFSQLTTSHQLNLPTSRQLLLPYTSSTIKNEVLTTYISSYLTAPRQLNLPTPRQLILPYTFSTIKGKIPDKLEYTSYLPTSRQLIFPYTSSANKAFPDNDTDKVTKIIDSLLENNVYKRSRKVFKRLREVEKINFLKEIKNKDEKLALVVSEKGQLNMRYLKLKGIVHLRGVFEQWESFHLNRFEGNRGNKWTKYLGERKVVLDIFRSFWQNPDEIDAVHVVMEVKMFYKWLSERIHSANAIGDHVEWSRNTLTPVQTKIAEYMCKDLNIEYHIVEPLREEAGITNNEVTQTNTIDEPIQTTGAVASEASQANTNISNVFSLYYP
ncbi:hypothetical protein RclHR1_01980004 [Rhizophagus clarus]|uniref:Uncharacterized protein n=1 Tax=Rhizophagus clarus TaxID=94130 RepID=A0A2Z6R2D9_9GLOM|nr:hypothetical protein RclHR1_01980004 [Rhizophagus clarus]